MVERIVIRYSSLGDIVLAGAVTAALGNVGFLTLPRWADLARRLNGVTDVFVPGQTLPSVPVIDLHNCPRSWAAALSARRIARYDWARRARVGFKTAPAPRVIERYAAAASVMPAPSPWMSPVTRGETLILAPGAAHATKRWPYWEALARAWPGDVRAVGGPEDAAIVARIGGVTEAGFEATLGALQGAAVLVAGDTGLLHLGAAVGLPVVGLFGPTTAQDGFWCHTGEALERPLSCRPCSRFGGPVCPIGDHACLRDLSVEDVIAAVRRVWPGT